MSSFIISTETMNLVVTTITATRRERGRIVKLFDGLSTDETENWQVIGCKLFAMNVAAVADRYPGDVGENDIATTYAFKWVRNTNLVAGFKAMQCLLYQCAEGDIYESPLYNELKRAINEIAITIVELLPPYEKAAWG